MNELTESGVQRIVDTFFAEALDDLIGLWQIVGRVEKGTTDPFSLREQTLRVVRALLARGLAAGEPPYSAGGLQVCSDQRPDAVINRIRSGWLALGRVPNIPDIVRFSRPD